MPHSEDKAPKSRPKLSRSTYQDELKRLQFELVRLQYWVKERGQRIIVIFEGRDAAGKGSTIKRIVDPLNPRGVRLVALQKPSDVERTQWYFQRYVAHLPAAGEIAIFDRSWYNRAGVEHVMGFCTKDEYWEFLHACPEFERLLVQGGLRLIKYWLSVSDDEQERRFQQRAGDPAKLWKLSPMDLLSRDRWVEYSKAKDAMMEYTDIPEAHWYQVEADDKRRAHLNCIRHLLSLFPYQEATPAPVKLNPRAPADDEYHRPPRAAQGRPPDHPGLLRPTALRPRGLALARRSPQALLQTEHRVPAGLGLERLNGRIRRGIEEWPGDRHARGVQLQNRGGLGGRNLHCRQGLKPASAGQRQGACDSEVADPVDGAVSGHWDSLLWSSPCARAALPGMVAGGKPRVARPRLTLLAFRLS